ncbi:MAG: SRPBCC family protein [Myxococcales bacterium]|nr:SRPBCC family protein [Myxococcales bacterium]
MTARDPEQSKLDLIFERHIAAPRAAVWRAWTDAEQLRQWWCPKPWQVPHAELDPRPGGIFRTIMRGPDGEESEHLGCYLEVIEHERLVFTDALGPGYRPTDKSFMTAIVTFTDRDGGTHYRAHVMHPTEAIRQQHEDMGFHAGWGAAADQLDALARAIAKGER